MRKPVKNEHSWWGCGSVGPKNIANSPQISEKRCILRAEQSPAPTNADRVFDNLRAGLIGFNLKLTTLQQTSAYIKKYCGSVKKLTQADMIEIYKTAK